MKVTLGFGFLLLFSRCVKITGSITDLATRADFKKSVLIVSGTAVANGSDQLTVYVRLLNSDGSVITNFTPTYFIQSGKIVQGRPCFPSDDHGLSICILKATSTGTRTLVIDNLKTVVLKEQIQFTPIPRNNNLLQVVSGSQQFGFAGSYSIRGTVGNATSTLKQVSSGYTVYASVQGAISSKDSSQ